MPRQKTLEDISVTQKLSYKILVACDKISINGNWVKKSIYSQNGFASILEGASI